MAMTTHPEDGIVVIATMVSGCFQRILAFGVGSIFLAGLAACTPSQSVTPAPQADRQTLPSGAVRINVTGLARSTGNTMTGAATGVPFGAGVLVFEISDGRRCEGRYDHISDTEGAGQFTCSSGPGGRFAFTSNGRAGGGVASVGTEDFQFGFVAS